MVYFRKHLCKTDSSETYFKYETSGRASFTPFAWVEIVRSTVMESDTLAGAESISNQKLNQEIIIIIPLGKYVC